MKTILALSAALALAGCGCKCRYNEYLPENNPLAIPDDLKP
jgi:outer membrane lipopolysaccharide assembly protein LptE/RlpB